MSQNERKRFWIALGLALLVMTAVLLPKRLTELECEKFAEPLFQHALPEGSRLVEKSAAKGDDGGYTAALILAWDGEAESLAAYFSDTEYPPAKKGQTVTLEAEPLNEDSLEALRQADLYKEDETYFFVYIYSAPQAE